MNDHDGTEKTTALCYKRLNNDCEGEKTALGYDRLNDDVGRREKYDEKNDDDDDKGKKKLHFAKRYFMIKIKRKKNYGVQ